MNPELTATINALEDRLRKLEVSGNTMSSVPRDIQELTRQVQTLQGGMGNLEPLSMISGWQLTAGFTDPNLTGGSTFIGQGQMLLSGKNITFSRPANSPFLQIAANSGLMNADYVVDSNGNGSHLTLFGASGALTAAIATAVSKSIWVCTTHVETVTVGYEFVTALATNQRVTVFSSSRHRVIFKVNIAGPLFLLKAGESHGIGAALRLQGIGFDRSTFASSDFYNGTGGGFTRNIELEDVTFRGTWAYLFNWNTASSVNIGRTYLHHVVTEDTITGIVDTSTASNNLDAFTLDTCDFAQMSFIVNRTNSTDGDAGTRTVVIDTHFTKITGAKGINPGGGLTFNNNIIDEFSGATAAVQVGTSANTAPNIGGSDSSIDDNRIYCSLAGSSAIILFAGAGTMSNISMMGNQLRGPGSGTAIAYNFSNVDCPAINSYRSWDTNVGGTVGPGSGSGAVMNHTILSAPHTDTLAAAVVAGDLMIGNATPKWARLGIGAAGAILTVSAGAPTWVAPAVAAAHVILSATHTDSLAAAVVAGDVIIGNATPKWARLAISVPAVNVRNVIGIDNAEILPSWKTALDATNPTTIGVSDAAAPGTSLVFSHRDHQHGSPATFPATAHAILSATHSDSTAAAVVRGDIITGQGLAPAWVRLAASVPAANVRNVLGFDNGDTEPAWKTALDATAPVTQAYSDVADSGTSLVFSHRDHKHGMPAVGVANHNIFSATHADTTGAAAPVDGDIIIGNITPAWSKLAITVPAANIRNVLGVDNGETRPSWKSILDGTNPSTSAVGNAASPGTSLISAHRDHTHGREAFANPGNSITLSVQNGVAATLMRSDAASALSQAIAPTWTALHQFSANNILAVYTDRAQIINATASDAVNTVQQSPSERYTAHVWNTTAVAADNTFDYRITLVPTSGLTPTALLIWGVSNNGAAYATKMSLSNTGQLDVAIGFRIAAAAASGNYLRGDGTNFVSSAIQFADVPVATNALLLSTAAAAGAASTFMRSNDTIAAFDATVPTTIGVSDVAAAGVINFAARRDHKHGSPATFTATAHNIFSATHGDTTGAASPVDGDIIIGNITPAWSKLAIAIPAANVRNVLGIDNAEVRPSWKTALDATAPTTIGVSDVAAAGTSLVFSHRDHQHGSPATFTATAHAILSARHTDALAAAVVDGDVIIGNVTPAWSRLAVVIPAVNVLNVLGTANGDLRPSWKVLFDGTNPTTIGISDAAAAGTSLSASHRDHQHASPATWTATAHNVLSAIHGDAAVGSVVRGDVIIGNSTPAWSRLAKGTANQVLSMNGAGTDVIWAAAGSSTPTSWSRFFMVMGG